MERRQPIGVELVKRGIVRQEDIEKALQYQRENPNRRLGDILHILNLCDSIILIEAIGEIIGTTGIMLTRNKIKINLEEYITLEMAKKEKVVPFEIINGKIKICFVDGVNNKNIDKIRLLMLNKGLIVEPYITFESEIENILDSLEQDTNGELDISGQGNTVTQLVDNIIRTGIA